MPGYKNEESIDQQVREFFAQYERANTASDVSAIGGLYAETFLFGGPNGIQIVKKEDFLKVVPKMKAHFSSLGLAETRFQVLEAEALGARYLLAKISCRLKFHRSSHSNDLDAFATYILARGNDGALSIIVQIDHQDLASAIKEQQGAHP
jgi:ketosteroid isomerase-like protein